MELIDIWHDIFNGKQPKVANTAQSVVDMLNVRASAYHAQSRRRNERKERFNRESSKEQIKDYELYSYAADYYYNYYSNGQLRKSPLSLNTNAYNGHNKTAESKHRYYMNNRCKAAIHKAMSQYQAKNGKPPSDKELVEYLYSLMPKTAFTDDELTIWQHIYEFATKVKTSYTAVKQSNHRNKKAVSGTYIQFADWLKQHLDYSSNDRNFVARMVKHYAQNGITLSNTKADELLRYCGSKEYFGIGDLQRLSLTSDDEIGQFFDTIDIIKQTTKKK